MAQANDGHKNGCALVPDDGLSELILKDYHSADL